MNKGITVLIIAVSCLFCMSAFADVTIDPGGSGDYTEIQPGIDAVSPGDTVWLVDATYTGTNNRFLRFNGKDIILRSVSDNPAACVIDCEHSATGIYLDGGETAASGIRGIKIQKADSVGIWLEGVSTAVTNCIFEDCWAQGTGGGGIFCQGSCSSVISNCIFTGNEAQGCDGGGMYCGTGTSPTIVKCVFSFNIGLQGGAMYCRSSSTPTITNCIFMHNRGNNGGGIYTQTTTPLLITNCTFACNQSFDGGGICCSTHGTCTVINTLFWTNSATNADAIRSWDPSTADYCIFSGIGCPTNVTCTSCTTFADNPMFADWTDFHILPGSSCIDQGTSDTGTYPSLPLDDIDGETRPQYSGYDIGADEIPQPTVTPTAAPTTPTHTPGPTTVPTTSPAGLGLLLIALGTLLGTGTALRSKR
jgi:Right handed beta helix region